MDQKEIEIFVEAALLAAGKPLSIDQIQNLFDGRSIPDKANIRSALESLNEMYADRGVVIQEVASGFRVQIRSGMAERLKKLWEERPPRYSRALFETLALIAYRQPITRGEIEEIRGVAVSSNIMRSLVEREWVRVVGHRDVPGRPAMFGTTKSFLDYFSLKKLEDLPELADLSDWESLRVQLDLPEVDGETANDPHGGEPAGVGEIVALPGADNHENGDLTDAVGTDEGSENAADDDALIPQLEVEDEGEAADPIEFPELQSEEDTSRVELPELSELVETAEESDDASVEEELIVSEWPDPAPKEDSVDLQKATGNESKDS